MEVTGIVTTLRVAEHGQLDVIAAARLVNGVQWLVQVAYKVDDPLEGLNALQLRGVFIRQNFLKELDAIDGAILVIGLRVLMFVLGTKAVAGVVKASGVLGDIDKMPAVRFIALLADFVGPAANRGQMIVTQQRANVLFGLGCQAGISDIGHDSVTFNAPSENVQGQKRQEKDKGNKFFHKASTVH